MVFLAVLWELGTDGGDTVTALSIAALQIEGGFTECRGALISTAACCLLWLRAKEDSWAPSPVEC